MSDKYITISIFDLDVEKISVDSDPRSGREGLCLLYDGKIPTITFNDGKAGKDKFMLYSFKGVEKKKVWDAGNRRFTDEWDGTYGISFTLTRTYKSPSAAEKLIMDKLEAIQRQVETSETLQELNGDFKCEPIANPTFVKKMIGGKMTKTKTIDQEKGVYLAMKCSYGAPKDAPTFKGKTGKDEPEFSFRCLATPFYHPQKGQANPENVIDKGMRCLPEATLSYSCVNGKHYLTLRMQKCYYLPVAVKTQAPDTMVLAQMASMIEDEENEIEQD